MDFFWREEKTDAENTKKETKTLVYVSVRRKSTGYSSASGGAEVGGELGETGSGPICIAFKL